MHKLNSFIGLATLLTALITGGSGQIPTAVSSSSASSATSRFMPLTEIKEGMRGTSVRSRLRSVLVVAQVAITLMLLVAPGLLRNLPQPVLAAIILMAVTGLFKFSELRRLWQHHRAEFLIAMAALLGVLWAGLLKGVLLGAVISLVMLIRRASTPHVAFLGRIPGTNRYSDFARHETNEPIPGILPFRVEASLLYFNVEHVSDTVMARIRSISPPPKVVICDLSTSPHCDMAGAHFLLGLHSDLEKRGIALRLVEARSKVRDILRLEGVEEKVGRIDRFTTLAAAIDNLRTETPEISPASLISS